MGDYTFHLKHSLEKLEAITVGVLTSSTEAQTTCSSDESIYRVMSSWKIRNLYTALLTIFQFKPDVIHFQYPTQGYDGRLSQLLPLFCKLLGFSVVQTWHEYYYASGVSFINAIACDALIFARPNFEENIPVGIGRILRNVAKKYIENAPTIPVVKLQPDRAKELKNKIASDRFVVSFFGFAHEDKGVERIFDIANPEKHQLVLICDLNIDNIYHKKILDLARKSPWLGNVTVTGYQSAEFVGEILSISDAVIFPFPKGAGEWNTSLKAAQAAGVFCLATSTDFDSHGYVESSNTCYVACNDISAMHQCLNIHIGRRINPMNINQWQRLALEHQVIYKTLGK